MSVDERFVSCATEGHCITCSDEARPARVLRVDDAAGLALVALNDLEGDVDISLVDEVRIGQILLIHGGVAIGRLEA